MSHYFTDPLMNSSPTRVNVTLRGRMVELMTDHGVFSRDGLDTGTKILLDAVPDPPAAGNLLDLGCGYGPIAIALAQAAPEATVWAVDINSRARQLCEYNCRNLGITTVRVCAPADVPDDISLSCIWSNPPIRIGKSALHELLTTWLDRLDEAGTAHLVVQKNLGSDSLHAWLNSLGWPTTRVLSRKAFRLLRVAARPRPHHVL
jgi:16S rRNA (guanine1207-N2)-methyltransferase